MESIKVLTMVDEAGIRDLKKRELIKYVFMLRKVVLKQAEKISYQKSKISTLKQKLSDLTLKEDQKHPPKAEPEATLKNEEEEARSFVEELKSAANDQSKKNGFIYEPTSGLYYDTKTGYYYNAECGLYYDGNTGKYYSYDQETNEFSYHSTAQIIQEEPATELIAPKRPRDKRKKAKKRERDAEELEEGEVSSEDTDVDISSSDENHFYDNISKHYPPSLRLIVQQSSSDKLKVGTLFLVTCTGGSLGREAQHDVVIPDVNVSKFHMKFVYDESGATYKCQDLGSRNGSILNGERMSSSKVESEFKPIPHGSVIQVSETKLSCHIHEGNSTCGNCEPGLLIKPDAQPNNTDATANLSHKSQLKLLQKKYGLEKEKYVEKSKSKSDPNYNDRAQHRRVTVGGFDSSEKTEQASVETSIPKSNKGFKMLAKLGWREGEALGKQDNENAILEPITVEGNTGTKGLGAAQEGPSTLPTSKRIEKKQLIWKKTQQRYNNSDKPQPIKTNIFGDDSNSDGEL